MGFHPRDLYDDTTTQDRDVCASLFQLLSQPSQDPCNWLWDSIHFLISIVFRPHYNLGLLQCDLFWTGISSQAICCGRSSIRNLPILLFSPLCPADVSARTRGTRGSNVRGKGYQWFFFLSCLQLHPLSDTEKFYYMSILCISIYQNKDIQKEHISS